eukprot:UN07053
MHLETGGKQKVAPDIFQGGPEIFESYIFFIRDKFLPRRAAQQKFWQNIYYFSFGFFAPQGRSEGKLISNFNILLLFH